MSDDFSARYRLLKCVLVEGSIRTHNAQQVSTGKVVMVHINDAAGPDEVDALRAQLALLPSDSKNKVLETATLPSGFAVVTEFLPGLTSFGGWLGREKGAVGSGDPSAPLGAADSSDMAVARKPAIRVSFKARSAGAPDAASGESPPAEVRSPLLAGDAATPPIAPLTPVSPAVSAQNAPARPISHATPLPAASTAPDVPGAPISAAAPVPVSPRAPAAPEAGSFTMLFGQPLELPDMVGGQQKPVASAPTPAPAIPAKSPPAAVPAAAIPSPMTTGDSFTGIFGKPVDPKTLDNGVEYIRSGAAAPAPISFSLDPDAKFKTAAPVGDAGMPPPSMPPVTAAPPTPSVAAPKPPGEFTLMFGSSAPTESTAAPTPAATPTPPPFSTPQPPTTPTPSPFSAPSTPAGSAAATTAAASTPVEFRAAATPPAFQAASTPAPFSAPSSKTGPESTPPASWPPLAMPPLVMPPLEIPPLAPEPSPSLLATPSAAAPQASPYPTANPGAPPAAAAPVAQQPSQFGWDTPAVAEAPTSKAPPGEFTLLFGVPETAAPLPDQMRASPMKEAPPPAFSTLTPEKQLESPPVEPMHRVMGSNPSYGAGINQAGQSPIGNNLGMGGYAGGAQYPPSHQSPGGLNYGAAAYSSGQPYQNMPEFAPAPPPPAYPPAHASPLFAHEKQLAGEQSSNPSILPPPIFSNGGSTPLSAFGGEAPRINANAGPSEYTQLIANGPAPVVPELKPKTTNEPAVRPGRRKLPTGLIIVINAILLIGTLLIFFVMRQQVPTLQRVMPAKPRLPSMPTAPAIPNR